MAKRKPTDYFLYHHRVGLAAVLVFAALACLLIVALVIPGGLTPAEQASTVSALHQTKPLGINAPYYWLQKASLRLVGFSVLGIKLPSAVLGSVLGISVFFLLQRWLTSAAALSGSLIIFSSTMFLTLAGTGSPQIMYVLYPAMLLTFGTRVLAHDRGLAIFALLLLATIALSLLTPTMIYVVVLALVLAAIHPHVRYGFRRLPIAGRILLTIGFLAALAPAVRLVMEEPDSLRQLLGVPSSVTPSLLITNLHHLGALFGRFLDPGLAYGIAVPFVGLSTIGLSLLGLYRIVRGLIAARAQFIIGWSLISLALAVLEPQYVVLLYLPIVLLAVFGLGQLIAIWYRTFPLNPYARASAIVPLGVLVIGIVAGSSLRYVNTMLYASGSTELYSHDLALLQTYAAGESYAAGTPLAVAPADVAFYDGFADNGTLFHHAILPVVPLTQAPAGGVISAQPLPSRGAPVRIITDSRSQDADRFYVYK